MYHLHYGCLAPPRNLLSWLHADEARLRVQLKHSNLFKSIESYQSLAVWLSPLKTNERRDVNVMIFITNALIDY